jgi:chromate transporter
LGRRGGLSLRQLFFVFFKGGLAFGGGVAMMAVLEEELVTRRRLMSREEFLAIYSIGRIAPCGTMTALAVALGHRFGGHRGIAAAIGGMLLPGFLSTIVLTAAYRELAHGPALGYVSVTLVPAAVALILVAALRLGRGLYRPSMDLVLATAALVGLLAFGISPALLLVAGGLIGAVVFRAPAPAAAAAKGDKT